GALIVLLSVAVDPFIQQVIQFQTRLVFQDNPLKNNATIAQAQRYSKGSEFTIAATSNLPFDFQAVRATADFSMQSAVLYGLTEPLDAVTQQISYHCATGNCKWNNFQSLAVCGICNDVSHQVRKGKPVTGDPLVISLEEDNTSEFEGQIVNASLPNGLFINTFETWKIGDAMSTLMTTFSTGTPNKTLTFKSKDSLFWSTTLMKIIPDKHNASAEWPNLPVQATECGLWYCVNEYTSAVVNGTVVPNSVENTTAQRSPDSWKPLSSSASGLATLEFSDSRSSVKRSDLMLGDGFNISQPAVDSISSFLQSQFIKNLSLGNLNGFVANTSTLEFGPPAVQPLFDSKSLNDTFHSVAASMTNALRNGADNARNVSGEHADYSTHYHVLWPWMALPIVLLLAGYLFLFLSHFETRKAGIPAWKSNELATLSRGHHAAKILRGANFTNEMQAKSR
ncbi:hypothetical protein NA57DRAFT_16228, partial [Rhizodiscina lignyota]